MTVQNAAAALLIILPLAFNLFFFLLGRRFDYPLAYPFPSDASAQVQPGRGAAGLDLPYRRLIENGRFELRKLMFCH